MPASALHWSSSAPGVVAVDSLRGVVTALAAGSAVLTVHVPGSMAVLGGTLVTVP